MSFSAGLRAQIFFVINSNYDSVIVLTQNPEIDNLSYVPHNSSNKLYCATIYCTLGKLNVVGVLSPFSSIHSCSMYMSWVSLAQILYYYLNGFMQQWFVAAQSLWRQTHTEKCMLAPDINFSCSTNVQLIFVHKFGLWIMFSAWVCGFVVPIGSQLKRGVELQFLTSFCLNKRE